jgi:signal transduction histidine kinase
VLPDYRSVACESALQCLELFRASRVILVYEEHDEPWVAIAEADSGGVKWREEEEEGFALSSLETNESCVLLPSAAQVWDRFRALLPKGPVLSCPVRSESVNGHLLVSEPAAAEALALAGEAVSTLIAIRFEATRHAQQAARMAVAEDRIRVARDLHDGLLQSFTGVVLQLETIHSTLDARPDEARKMITETQGLIMADQRELRRFVEELRPRPARRETDFDFGQRLEDLRSRFEKQWGIHVSFDVDHIQPLVARFLGRETFRLIYEAVTNSAKHGGASEVRVGVKTAGSEIHIEVTDNGAGFPFHGRVTLDELKESGTGPMVLAERVSSLNGTMTVDSTDNGATVTISIPLGWGAA